MEEVTVIPPSEAVACCPASAIADSEAFAETSLSSAVEVLVFLPHAINAVISTQIE